MKIGVFLVFLLALHHCDAGELILAAAPTQKARPCETSFVATSQRAQDFYQPKASHLCPYLEETSLSGSSTPCPYPTSCRSSRSVHHGGGRLLALQEVLQDSKLESCALPFLWRTLEQDGGQQLHSAETTCTYSYCTTGPSRSNRLGMVERTKSFNLEEKEHFQSEHQFESTESQESWTKRSRSWQQERRSSDICQTDTPSTLDAKQWKLCSSYLGDREHVHRHRELRNGTSFERSLSRSQESTRQCATSLGQGRPAHYKALDLCTAPKYRCFGQGTIYASTTSRSSTQTSTVLAPTSQTGHGVLGEADGGFRRTAARLWSENHQWTTSYQHVQKRDSTTQHPSFLGLNARDCHRRRFRRNLAGVRQGGEETPFTSWRTSDQVHGDDRRAHSHRDRIRRRSHGCQSEKTSIQRAKGWISKCLAWQVILGSGTFSPCEIEDRVPAILGREHNFMKVEAYDLNRQRHAASHHDLCGPPCHDSLHQPLHSKVLQQRAIRRMRNMVIFADLQTFHIVENSS